MNGYFQPSAQDLSGSIGSGTIASGSVLNANIGSGQVQGIGGTGVPNVASGTFTGFELGSGSVVSGRIASGQLGRFHMASGCVTDLFFCEAAISGIVAVAWGSGGCFLVPAQRASGLRLPAVGVVAGNFASGANVPVIRQGLVTTALSGLIASGFPGQPLYVGSGGLIINQSGFCGGASSGQGAAPTAAGSGYSGALVQQVGVSVSGGIDVFLGEARSGLISGLLGQY